MNHLAKYGVSCIILGWVIQKYAKYAHISTVISPFISESVGVRDQALSIICNGQQGEQKRAK